MAAAYDESAGARDKSWGRYSSEEDTPGDNSSVAKARLLAAQRNAGRPASRTGVAQRPALALSKAPSKMQSSTCSGWGDEDIGADSMRTQRRTPRTSGHMRLKRAGSLGDRTAYHKSEQEAKRDVELQCGVDAKDVNVTVLREAALKRDAEENERAEREAEQKAKAKRALEDKAQQEAEWALRQAQMLPLYKTLQTPISEADEEHFWGQYFEGEVKNPWASCSDILNSPRLNDVDPCASHSSDSTKLSKPRQELVATAQTKARPAKAKQMRSTTTTDMRDESDLHRHARARPMRVRVRFNSEVLLVPASIDGLTVTDLASLCAERVCRCPNLQRRQRTIQADSLRIFRVDEAGISSAELEENAVVSSVLNDMELVEAKLAVGIKVRLCGVFHGVAEKISLKAVGLALLIAAAVTALAILIWQIVLYVPEHAKFHGKGVIALAKGEHERAETYFNQAISLQPESSKYMAALADALRHQDRRLEAAAAYERIIATAPKDLTPNHGNRENILLAYAHLATVQHKLGMHVDAKHTFEESLRLNPNCTISRMGYARLLVESNHLHQAQVHLQKLVKINPRHSRAQVDLGNLMSSNGQLEEAEHAHRLATDIAPQDPASWLALGRTLRLAAKLTEAVSTLEYVGILHPRNGNALLELGKTRKAQGNAKEAMRLFRAASKVRPADATPSLSIAELLTLNGDVGGAIQAYQDAATIDPQNLKALNQLATLLTGVRRFDETVYFAEKAVQIDDRQASSWRLLIDALTELGRYGEAMQHRREASEKELNEAL